MNEIDKMSSFFISLSIHTIISSTGIELSLWKKQTECPYNVSWISGMIWLSLGSWIEKISYSVCYCIKEEVWKLVILRGFFLVYVNKNW